MSLNCFLGYRVVRLLSLIIILGFIGDVGADGSDCTASGYSTHLWTYAKYNNGKSIFQKKQLLEDQFLQLAERMPIAKSVMD